MNNKYTHDKIENTTEAIINHGETRMNEDGKDLDGL